VDAALAAAGHADQRRRMLTGEATAHNVFGVINKEAAEMVATTIRMIFAQPTAGTARTQLDLRTAQLGSAARGFR
jgi:hypothetical protein